MRVKWIALMYFMVAFGSLFSESYQLAQEIRENPKIAQQVNFMVGFPRSGNNWMKNIVQSLGHYPVYPLCGTYALENPLGVAIDHDKSPFFVMHVPNWIEGASPECNKIIIIVRDYKECFYRQAIADRADIENTDITQLQLSGYSFVSVYLNILRIYDSWLPENRYLVYYEELIQYPETVIGDLAQFLGEEPNQLSEFFLNFEELKKQSIAYYNKIEGANGGSITEGKDVFHYREFYTEEQMRHIDEVMKIFGEDLWEKYLSHYEGI